MKTTRVLKYKDNDGWEHTTPYDHVVDLVKMTFRHHPTAYKLRLTNNVEYYVPEKVYESLKDEL